MNKNYVFLIILYILILAFEVLELVSWFIWEYYESEVIDHQKSKLFYLLDSSVTFSISASVFPMFYAVNLVYEGWKLNIHDKDKNRFYCIPFKTWKHAGGDRNST